MTKKRRKNSLQSKIIILIAEILVVVSLLLVFSQNFGFGTQITIWINQLTKPSVQELDITGINSSYAVLMQAGTGKVIGDINGDTQMYPASMTKIMTTIVAIENLSDLDQQITLTNDMVADLYAQDATQAGFQPGETAPAIDYLYGVMLPSGAECCRALAVTIAGSEDAFVDLMNQKAEKLGLDNTHFCNTTGLHADNHYSTAKDIATLLLRKFIINPEFCIGCGKCARNCPAGAITGAKKQPHTINNDLCIKCGACKDNCSFDAIYIEA